MSSLFSVANIWLAFFLCLLSFFCCWRKNRHNERKHGRNRKSHRNHRSSHRSHRSNSKKSMKDRKKNRKEPKKTDEPSEKQDDVQCTPNANKLTNMKKKAEAKKQLNNKAEALRNRKIAEPIRPKEKKMVVEQKKKANKPSEVRENKSAKHEDSALSEPSDETTGSEAAEKFEDPHKSIRLRQRKKSMENGIKSGFYVTKKEARKMDTLDSIAEPKNENSDGDDSESSSKKKKRIADARKNKNKRPDEMAVVGDKKVTLLELMDSPSSSVQKQKRVPRKPRKMDEIELLKRGDPVKKYKETLKPNTAIEDSPSPSSSVQKLERNVSPKPKVTKVRKMDEIELLKRGDPVKKNKETLKPNTAIEDSPSPSSSVQQLERNVSPKQKAKRMRKMDEIELLKRGDPVMRNISIYKPNTAVEESASSSVLEDQPNELKNAQGVKKLDETGLIKRSDLFDDGESGLDSSGLSVSKLSSSSKRNILMPAAIVVAPQNATKMDGKQRRAKKKKKKKKMDEVDLFQHGDPAALERLGFLAPREAKKQDNDRTLTTCTESGKKKTPKQLPNARQARNTKKNADDQCEKTANEVAEEEKQKP